MDCRQCGNNPLNASALTHLYNGHMFNGPLSWSHLYSGQIYNRAFVQPDVSTTDTCKTGQLYYRTSVVQRTHVQPDICTARHLTNGQMYNGHMKKPDSCTTGHLYNGLLKNGHLYTWALVKAAWTHPLVQQTFFYNRALYKCTVVQQSFIEFSILQMSGRTRIRLSSALLYNCPILQMNFFQTSFVQVLIVHIPLYNCPLYKLPLYIYPTKEWINTDLLSVWSSARNFSLSSFKIRTFLARKML